jgi:hypothetical protein
MKKSILFLLLIMIIGAIIVLLLNGNSSGSLISVIHSTNNSIIHADGKTVMQRFNTPEKYSRVPLSDSTFGNYLRNYPVQKHGSEVYYFDGKKKPKDVHEAVLDIDVGKKDLQQCADAIIRLYAEYLYAAGRYDEIGFHFTSGFFCDYNHWENGYRVKVSGNNVSWVKSTSADESYHSFRAYLETVFMYAGTLSLSKELTSVAYTDLMPGDVIIQGGSPGHAVVVIDCAINEDGQKLFILAQSYMPAQSIHVLKNLFEPEISPWYRLNPEDRIIETPEWNFQSTHCKRFPVIR